MKKIIGFMLLVISVLFFSCSEKEDSKNEPACVGTNIAMTLNGEVQYFLVYGRSIDEGILQLTFQRYIEKPETRQYLDIYVKFKKTGENVIEKIRYTQYGNDPFRIEASQEQISSTVLINRNTCFASKFSVALNDGNHEVIISNAQASWIYEEPYDY